MEKGQKAWFEGFEFERGAPPTASAATSKEPREVLAQAIDHQIKRWHDPEHKVKRYGKNGAEEKVVRPWWTEQNGKVYLALRYGNRPIEFRGSTAPLVFKDKDKVVPFLQAFKGAVQEGEFDAQLKKMKDDIAERLRKGEPKAT